MKSSLVSLVLLVFVFAFILVFGSKGANEQDMFTENVAPRWIQDGEINGVPLSAELKKIKDVVRERVLLKEPGNEEYYENMALIAVGNRYVVINAMAPKDGGSSDLIVDLYTGKITSIPGTLVLRREDGLQVYGTSTGLCTYKPNQSLCTPLPNSLLYGTETYDGCEGCGGGPEILQTHTDSTITLAVFDTAIRTSDPDTSRGSTSPKMVREITITLP